MKNLKYIPFRLIGFPFVLALILICAIRDICYDCTRWLCYGGELVISTKKTKDTISTIMNMIEDKKNNQ